MLNIQTLTLGDYQTNCYLLSAAGSRECCIIDPGYEARTIRNALEKQQLEPKAILLTHGHFDHVGAVRELATETGCPVYLSGKDLSLPPIITNGPLYYTHTYPADGAVRAAGLSIRVIPTPGHTPGSVCLIVEDAMFSGDTLFAGSCGRTDLPGGSWGEIIFSLRTLASLPGDYSVYPGHGDPTTLEWERKTNSYLRASMRKHYESDTDRS